MPTGSTIVIPSSGCQGCLQIVTVICAVGDFWQEGVNPGALDLVWAWAALRHLEVGQAGAASRLAQNWMPRMALARMRKWTTNAHLLASRWVLGDV